jgi:hypothetical protein
LDAGVGTQCPITKLGIDVNYYNFMYDDPVANGNSKAGSEWDIIISHKHSENVSFEVSFARFLVGDALDNPPGTPTDSIDRLGGDVKIKF